MNTKKTFNYKRVLYLVSTILIWFSTELATIKLVKPQDIPTSFLFVLSWAILGFILLGIRKQIIKTDFKSQGIRS